ncbi:MULTISPECIES: sensor histidine kinase [unclassified Variovorax]|uniref:sensor histidine kinase n=1 Tax=unclassified Variovorax TaxID=663243 RepID=UPI000D12232D|nr:MULTISPECIES: sensor histidine kinase [unclassified Variovorax]AVQ85609.1 hypothetical protein C4F17_31910 [Variovorax sp. PMC12]QRY35237.1 sensor histidine kinase [Variovorax sp. PDNC026]
MELQASSSDRELAGEASRVLEEFAAGMRGVLQRLQAAANSGQHEDQEFFVLRLKGMVHHGERLARHLQAYAGLQPLTPTRLETLPFLCDLAHMLRRVLDDRISVSVVVGHDCPSCHADGDALEEALMHLVVNACEAMPKGGRLLLSARADTAPDGRPAVAVSVSDNGIGMSPDFARRAVQPFVTTKSGRADAGMGLAAVDGFARQSGGHLTLFSQVGTGVTATLSLPRCMPDYSPPFDV